MKPDDAEKAGSGQKPEQPSFPQNEQLLDVLKQNVLKWEEAANAIDQWLPKLTALDRAVLMARQMEYRRNACNLRKFINELVGQAH